MRLIRVAVPVPALEALTYRVPDGFLDPVVGARVLVPLGTAYGHRARRRGNSRPEHPATVGPRAAPSPKPRAEPVRHQGHHRRPRRRAFLPADVVTLAAGWPSTTPAGRRGDRRGDAAAALDREREVRAAHRRARAARCRARLRRDSSTAHGRSRCASTRCLATARHARGAPGARAGRPDRRHSALKGSADAFRTVRLAALTCAGCRGAGAEAGRDSVRRSSFCAPRRTASTRRPWAARHCAPTLSASPPSAWCPSRRRVDRDPFDACRRAAPCGRREAVTLTAEQEQCAGASAPPRRRELCSGRCSTASPAAARPSCTCGSPMRCREAGQRRAAAGAGDRADAGGRRRLPRAFGERVAIQHSGLSDGERHDQWQRIRRGDVDVVVGTRSAVFAPVRALGLIIVDEEHDSSYKQEESPRYHGRDVAVMRAPTAQARWSVLGSATPSLESYHNARDRPLRADRARQARPRPAAGRACASSTCARSMRPTGPDVDPQRAAARGHRRAARARRAGDGAAEPPRLRDRACSAGSAARRSSARTAACR